MGDASDFVMLSKWMVEWRRSNAKSDPLVAVLRPKGHMLAQPRAIPLETSGYERDDNNSRAHFGQISGAYI